MVKPADRLCARASTPSNLCRIASTLNGTNGYELYHITLRDHIQNDTSGIVGNQNQLAREEYCQIGLEWAKLPAQTPSRFYARRFGPDHLLDAPRYDDVYALARDTQFLEAQRREIETEMDASMRTSGLSEAALQAVEAVPKTKTLIAGLANAMAARGDEHNLKRLLLYSAYDTISPFWYTHLCASTTVVDRQKDSL